MTANSLDPRVLLGQRIRELRARHGVTQEELADRCCMFRTYLSRIESGRANPTLTVLHGLSQGLGVSVVELLSAPGEAVERVRVLSAHPVSRGRVKR